MEQLFDFRANSTEDDAGTHSGQATLSFSILPLHGCQFLTPLHSDRPKLYTILAFLSAIGLKESRLQVDYGGKQEVTTGLLFTKIAKNWSVSQKKLEKEELINLKYKNQRHDFIIKNLVFQILDVAFLILLCVFPFS